MIHIFTSDLFKMFKICVQAIKERAGGRVPLALNVFSNTNRYPSVSILETMSHRNSEEKFSLHRKHVSILLIQ